MNLDSCKEGQRLTITTFDRPLMVAAGAGSGKTFTLTRRIAYGLLAGEGKSGGLRSVDEVLAITFTVKAAAELRDRIRGLLREEGLRRIEKLLAKAANEATQLGVSRDELHSMLDLMADEPHTEK